MQAHDEFVEVFLEIMFHSLKSLRRKDEREASLQLEQWEGHGTLKSSSQDVKIKANFQKQPAQTLIAKIGIDCVN